MNGFTYGIVFLYEWSNAMLNSHYIHALLIQIMSYSSYNTHELIGVAFFSIQKLYLKMVTKHQQLTCIHNFKLAPVLNSIW